MSHSYYMKLYKESEKLLDPTLEWDLSLQNAKKKIKDPAAAHATVFTLYYKYITLIKNLDQCYDQIVQPQKRPLLRRLLDLCIEEPTVEGEEGEEGVGEGGTAGSKAVLTEEPEQKEPVEEPTAEPPKETPPPDTEEGQPAEGGEAVEGEVLIEGEVPIEGEIIPAELTEEDELAELRKKLPPPEIEMTPQQRREIRWAREAERAAERLRIAQEKEETWLKEAKEAVRIIQIAERARQARYRYAVQEAMVSMRRETEMKQRGEKPQVKITDEDRENAANKIQRGWNRHLERKKRELDLFFLLGMIIPSWTSTAEQDRDEEVHRLRYDVQDDNLVDFLEDERLTLKYFKIKKAPWLFEDYTDDIREWFIEWYTKAKCFPEYPKEEDGGSNLVVQGLVKTPEEFMKEQEDERVKNMKKKSPKPEKKKTKEQIMKEKKEAKEKEEKKKRDEEKRRLQDEKDNPGFKMKESPLFNQLYDTNQSYKDIWLEKNERTNPLQKHYMDLIEAEKLNEVEVGVRKAVDDMMRLELERLNEALRRDKAKRKKFKGKGGQGAGKKKKKGKKGKGKKGKKKKKDPTADKTTEELFSELYMNNIIRSYPEVKLSSFFGDHNYSAFEDLKHFKRPLHALGDVRNLVNQYCILPIGSPLVHQMAPLIKSVCIIGPPGCGKHTLANAVCTELGAVVFDLSPVNIVGKYEGKAGQQMLIHLVSKLSRLLQPSVIYVDGAEKPFYKKVPKAEKEIQPKRLAKLLPKIIKPITKDDQVLVLGVSNQPWAARPKPLVKTYNKFILVPRPDYRNTHFYWQTKLMKYHMVDRYFDTSSLAMLTHGYSIRSINELLEKVMTEKRIMDQVRHPLTPQELLEGLIDIKPITVEDEAKYFDWFNKRTPLGKKLTKALKEQEELREREAKVKKK
ncbi:hypothetical protein C0J52_08623 [Blattella germanica]|nr:hypothetical protein C0J52_08623 [Blattella germanica]